MKNSLLFILFSLPILLLSQRPSLDSMLRVVETEPDTTRVKTYGKISFGFIHKNTDSALHYGILQRDLAQQLTDTAMLKSGVAHMALAYKYLGDYETSLELELETLKWNRYLNNERGIAISLASIATLYKRLKDFALAEDYFRQSIAMREEMQDSALMASAYNNFGILLSDLGRKEESLQFHQRSLDTYLAMGRERGISNVYGNIGSSLMSLNRLDEAKKYIQEGLKRASADGDRVSVIYSLANLGIIAEKQE